MFVSCLLLCFCFVSNSLCCYRHCSFFLIKSTSLFHASMVGFLQSLTVAFSSDTGTTTFNVTCIKSVTIADQNLDIFCEEKKPVNYVIFTGEGVSSLCSVHISGGIFLYIETLCSKYGNELYWPYVSGDIGPRTEIRKEVKKAPLQREIYCDILKLNVRKISIFIIAKKYANDAV